MVSNAEFKQEYLEEAFSLGLEALEANEVPIGCVIVYKNELIVGGGRNRTNETKNSREHAEILAIDEVYHWSKREGINPFDVFKECALYVTIEPCIMCASACLQLEIPLIVYSADNSRFGGCGSVYDVFSITPEKKPKILKGFQSERAIQLLQQFYEGENPNVTKP